MTFYKRKGKGLAHIEILCRYLLPWETYPEAQEWHGTYDDILDQMRIDFPF